MNYRFDDWLTLGIKAHQEGKLEIAAEHFGKAAEIAEKPVDHVTALFNKGITLGQMGKSDEEIAVYDEMTKRYGDDPEAGVRERVVNALVNKGIALDLMGENEKAIAVYDEVVKRYGDAQEAGVREQVVGALNGKGFRFLCAAKKVWQAGDETTARAILAKALLDIEAALVRKSDNPICLGNQGYILFLQGKVKEAGEILAKAILLGGEKLRKNELEDADIHPLPQDGAFKALINSL